MKRSQQLSQYHYVSGQVIEVDGLKGELDHLELYIKVRLNIHPMHQRQQKFSRGPVIHKTRTLRGSTRPQWKEDFMVTGLLVASSVGGICCLGDMSHADMIHCIGWEELFRRLTSVVCGPG